MEPKTEAAQWLKCVWEAMCKQRKDELALLEKAKQDDVWTEHLQQRVDNLIVELRQLEADALAFGTGPNPLPAEEELEERLLGRHVWQGDGSCLIGAESEWVSKEQPAEGVW